MDRGLDPHLQRIVDNATGLNNNKVQQEDYDFSLGEHTVADWSFRPGPRQPPQEHASFSDSSQFFREHLSQSTNTLSISGRIPFDPPYHTHPAPLAGSSRISLAPRSIYNHSDREPRTLNNGNNHFGFAQNLHEGRAINPAPPKQHQLQPPGPIAPQRNPLFSQQQTEPQPRDSIDQLANAMLMQNSIPPLHTKPAPSNFFHRRQPSVINQLQPQKPQVTPPFNLSRHSISFSGSY
jgi:ATP-dependent DNA helicase HFM1/MER3